MGREDAMMRSGAARFSFVRVMTALALGALMLAGCSSSLPATDDPGAVVTVLIFSGVEDPQFDLPEADRARLASVFDEATFMPTTETPTTYGSFRGFSITSDDWIYSVFPYTIVRSARDSGALEATSTNQTWAVEAYTMLFRAAVPHLSMQVIDELPSVAGAIENGTHFGFASEFSGGALTLTLAELYIDQDEAAAESAKDGLGEPPNGFYIREPDGDPVSLPVANQATVSVIDGGTMQPESIGLERLTAMYDGSDNPSWMYGTLDRWPVTITVANGVVTDISEQYVP